MHPNSMTAGEPASLYDALQDYLEAVRRQRRSPETLRVYRLYGTRFVQFLHDRGIDQPTLEHLSVDLVGKYQDHVRGQSRGSRDGACAEQYAVRTLKIFSRWLWRRNVFDVDPLARVEAPRVVKLHGAPFAKGDCALMLEAAQLGPDPLMERALLLLSLDTGCRIGELCAVDVADLDLEAGTVLFRTTKGGRPRRVFFRVAGQPDGGPCVVALREWLTERSKRAQPGNHALFVTRRWGVRLTTDRARRIYRALGEFAGMKRCHPHMARHTHATQFLAELPGAELHLRRRLGHLSQEMLSTYVTISDGVARDVADVASVSQKWGL